MPNVMEKLRDEPAWVIISVSFLVAFVVTFIVTLTVLAVLTLISDFLLL